MLSLYHMKLQHILILLLFPFAIQLQSCELVEDTGLSDEEIISGLKEALRVASDTSVTHAQQVDGYNGNSLIRIPFPSEFQNVATTVGNFSLLGLPVGQEAVDAFVVKLNRAAEGAADKALPILVDAIQGITITDGLGILMGHDSAATEYLEANTYSSLKTTFQPDIEASLNEVGAQTAWGTVAGYYNTITGQTVNPDLADYTTERALNGLFTLVSLEEKKIRDDPAARVTDLLQRVFAEQD